VRVSISLQWRAGAKEVVCGCLEAPAARTDEGEDKGPEPVSQSGSDRPWVGQVVSVRQPPTRREQHHPCLQRRQSPSPPLRSFVSLRASSYSPPPPTHTHTPPTRGAPTPFPNFGVGRQSALGVEVVWCGGWWWW
jgi:hypothetical protein